MGGGGQKEVEESKKAQSFSVEDECWWPGRKVGAGQEGPQEGTVGGGGRRGGRRRVSGRVSGEEGGSASLVAGNRKIKVRFLQTGGSHQHNLLGEEIAPGLQDVCRVSGAERAANGGGGGGGGQRVRTKE